MVSSLWVHNRKRRQDSANGWMCQWYRRRLWYNLHYFPGICMEELRKTLKNLMQDSLCFTWDSNQALSKYEMFSCEPTCSDPLVFMV
jgi:hypothetical protein